MNQRFLFKYCLYLLLVLKVGYLSGQSESWEFDKISFQEGLSHNTVNHIIQDHLGFFWFATYNGLNRFDGYKCQVFLPVENDSTSVCGKKIYGLLEDSKNRLWIGTRGYGACRFNWKSETFTTIKSTDNNLERAWVDEFWEDKKGQIWAGTIDFGLYLYNEKKNVFEPFHGANGKFNYVSVSDFAEDKDGTIWVANEDAVITAIDSETKETSQVKILKDDGSIISLRNFKKCLHIDNSGYLWIGTDGGGTFKMNLKTREFEEVKFPNDRSELSMMMVTDISEDKKGNLLFTFDGAGLMVYDPVNTIFVHNYYNPESFPKGLNSNAIYNVMVDTHGNCWLGTYNGGVNVWKALNDKFSFYTHRKGGSKELSHKSVLATFEDSKNQIWLGTDGGGVNILNPKTREFDILKNEIGNPNSISTNVIKSICEDKSGMIWLGTYGGGLESYDPKTKTFKHYRTTSVLTFPHIWSVLEDNSNNIWCATLGNGVYRIAPDRVEIDNFRNEPGNSKSIAGDVIEYIFVDSRNRIWMSMDPNGLDMYNEKLGHFQHFTFDPEDSTTISSNEVLVVFEDSKKRIWVGTNGGGLNLLNERAGHFTFTTIRKEDGLASDVIKTISEDEEGYLWLGTNKGICLFNPDQLTFRSFGFDDGLYGNQYNIGASILSNSGDLYFGGIEGLNVVSQKRIVKNPIPPRVVLTDLKISNNSIRNLTFESAQKIIGDYSLSETRDIVLNYYENVVSFEFAALDFTKPEKNRYAYKMDGFDEDWNFVDANQRLITYTNLDGGDYLLRVKATNNDGVWSEELLLTVKVIPPFWETLWFKLLLLVSTVSAIYLVTRLYFDRMVKEQERRTLHAEKKVLNLENEKLQSENSSSSSKLTASVMHTAHKNEILSHVKKQLQEIYGFQDENGKPAVRSLIRKIEGELNDEDYWDQFNFNFDQVNQDFIKKLSSSHNNLTRNDLKMVALIRLNLSTKEMASILNISVKGVEKSRYRLKKKLNLTAKHNLTEFILSL